MNKCSIKTRLSVPVRFQRDAIIQGKRFKFERGWL